MQEKKKHIAFMLLLCLVGMVCDLAVHIISAKLVLPLFLDMTFTCAICFYGGFFWATLEHVFYSFFMDAILGSSYFGLSRLYILCVISVLLTVDVFNRLVIKKHSATIFSLFANLIALSLITCIVASVSGGAIATLIAQIIGTENEFTHQTDLLMLLFSSKINSPLLLQIISRIPVNLADRLIMVFAGYGISSLVKRKFPFARNAGLVQDS